MALIDEARTWLRVSHEATDAEIQDMLNEALTDMARCGVKESMLSAASPSTLVKGAMRNYVKGQYGYDNDEARRFMESYHLMVANLLNSDGNERSE